jgi:hypothetical protein
MYVKIQKNLGQAANSRYVEEKVALQDRWPLERGWIHMKMSMTGQEKDDILIQVTA